MDGLTFTAELLKATAWPITILIIILIFRDEIVNLIQKIKRFKHNDTEIEFGKELDEIKQTIKNQTYTARVIHFVSKEDGHLNQLLRVSPRAAIIETWIQLEDALLSTLIDFSKEFYLDPSRKPSSSTNAEMLFAMKILSEDEFALYKKLSRLRNKAVHDSESKIDQLQAREFCDLTLKLTNQIKQKEADNSEKMEENPQL